MRPILETQRIDPKAQAAMAGFHSDFLANVLAVVEREPIVVIGMRQNPVVKKLRKSLKSAGIDYTYLEYGSYLSKWKQRLSIKLWSGWPTFPQVFIRGTLIGGCAETEALMASGGLKKMME